MPNTQEMTKALCLAHAFSHALFMIFCFSTWAATTTSISLSNTENWQNNAQQGFNAVDARPSFDIPVTYNTRVKSWVIYFQGNGRKWFRTWLERSSAYLPLMQATLKENGLPQDLAYIAMIESGFSAHAISDADAVGYWQFIHSTASRYGLKVNWWLDERRDFIKSTKAASRYLGDLYKMFGSWYLTAAAYNMGEGRTQRLVQRYKTKNYWLLAKKNDFPKETSQYIPKLLAAMLIAKAPKLYGFNDLQLKPPYRYEYFHVPGGTDLVNMARHFKIEEKFILKLNPELVRGLVPSNVGQHRIRIPQGWTVQVAKYIRTHI